MKRPVAAGLFLAIGTAIIAYFCPVIDFSEIDRELVYNSSKSSGPGGQHVNKTSSRVEVIFDLEKSTCFTEDEKNRLAEKLSSHIDSKGLVHTVCSNHRSQFRNKACAKSRLIALLSEGLKIPKKRKRTKPSKKSIEKRLKNKRIKSERKSFRKKGIVE